MDTFVVSFAGPNTAGAPWNQSSGISWIREWLRRRTGHQVVQPGPLVGGSFPPPLPPFLAGFRLGPPRRVGRRQRAVTPARTTSGKGIVNPFEPNDLRQLMFRMLRPAGRTQTPPLAPWACFGPVSYTHLRAHETDS